MNENANNPDLKRRIIIGCSFLVFISITGCALLLFVGIYRSEIPILQDYFPTATSTPRPTQTPAPHILVHTPSNPSQVLKENFDTNQNNWSSYYSQEKVELKDGKLFLEVFLSNSIGIAECYCKSQAHQLFEDAYYLQADLSTNRSPLNNGYGLVFSLTEDGDFYEFNIYADKQAYSLQKHLSTGWVNLFSGENKNINPYSETNTLSVYFDHGMIELFVNGQKLTSYTDKKPINKGKIGLVIDNSDFVLIADNLFAYQK